MSARALPVLLPRPKTVTSLPGIFKWPRRIWLPVAPPGLDIGWEIDMLRRQFNGGRAGSKTPVQDPRSTIRLQCPDRKGATGSAERYTLRIEPAGIWVQADAAPGLRMGLRTLIQIVEQASAGRRGARPLPLPCLRVADEPALALRAVHADMKGATFTLDYWRQVFDRLAALKINAVVLEYEDKFPFSRKLGVAGADAYSTRQVRQLVGMLHERGLAAIPLQQCFGHLHYVLRHPQYAALREDHRFYGQPCPLRPGSARLVLELLDEVADLHPGEPYFHLGGDEVRMGACPQCAAKARQRGTSSIYVDFVEPLCDHLVGRGYRPMLWADMLLRYYEDNRRLAGKAVLVDWNYGATEQSTTAYFWRRYQEMSAEEFAAYHEFPAHKREFEPFFPKPGDRRIDPLYTSRYLQARGYQVVGAPAVSTGHSFWSSDLDRNLKNVICHSRSAAEKGLLGTLTTRWSGCAAHWESAWPGLFAGAAYAWNPAVSQEEFERDFSRLFWDAPDNAVLAAVRRLGGLKPVTGDRRFCQPTYDGAMGPRDVRSEWRAVLARSSPAPLLETAVKCSLAARALRRAATSQLSDAKRNRRTLEYFDLAGQALQLRSEQDRLVLMAVLGRNVPPTSSQKLSRDERRLQRLTRERLGGTMTRPMLDRLLALLFEGERDLSAFVQPAWAFALLP